jgi:hypothetical protein
MLQLYTMHKNYSDLRLYYCNDVQRIKKDQKQRKKKKGKKSNFMIKFQIKKSVA